MIFGALKNVFKNPLYIVIAGFVSLVVFLFSVWLANFMLIWQVFTSSQGSIMSKLNLLVGLAASIQTNFSLLVASYIILIAVLFGINIAMIAFYISKRRSINASSGLSGALGIIVGLFGVGCASCGTVLLGPALSIFGAAGLLAFMPFGGGELGILSVGLLGFSILLTARKIQQPLVC